MFILHENPSSVIDSKQQLELNELKYHPETQSWYRYVQNGSASPTWTSGKLVCQKDGGDAGVLTQLAADCLEYQLVNNGAAFGMAVAAIPTLYFGYVLVQGRTAILETDGSVAKGDSLVMAGGATPTFIAHTAVATEEHQVFGIAHADDAGTPTVVTATVRFHGA